MDELISRAGAVKAALDVYHQLEEKRSASEASKDINGVIVYTAGAVTAQDMVQRLMELPAGGDGSAAE